MRANLQENNFDLDQFLSSIESFEMMHESYPSYTIMNYQTYKAIAYRHAINYTENDTHVNKIFGIPIAYSNSLPFGTVDLV